MADNFSARYFLQVGLLFVMCISMLIIIFGPLVKVLVSCDFFGSRAGSGSLSRHTFVSMLTFFKCDSTIIRASRIQLPLVEDMQTGGQYLYLVCQTIPSTVVTGVATAVGGVGSIVVQAARRQRNIPRFLK